MTIFTHQDSYRPFAYPWAVELTKYHQEVHWTESDIKNLDDDLKEWRSGKLSEEHKALIAQILRMFTQQDVAVGANYIPLLDMVENNEIRCMWFSFADREVVHQRNYALINDTLGLPESEYSAFMEYAAMKEKWEHMTEPVSGRGTSQKERARILAHNLAKMVFAEGVSLFSSFVVLMNFSRSVNGGTMKAVRDIVAYSINDENIHVDGNTKVFRHVCEEFPMIVNDEFKKAIYEMIRKSVAIEDKFVDLAFKEVECPNLTKEEVKKFVRFLADRRLVQLGLKANWHVKENPLPWLDEVLMNKQENFFERSVSNYSRGNMSGEWDDSLYTD